jgi:RimJ/RimL family protein N-acetyltransferase
MWQPTLQSSRISLRPLRGDDFDVLYAVANDPLIWEQHPESTRWQREVFTRFFDGAMASGGALLITDPRTGQVVGSSRWYEWDAAAREVAIGYTFLARSHWGGGVTGELKHLMLQHAFQHAQRVWFHVGPENFRSQRALEKIGACHSHTTLMDATRGGRDCAYYVIDAPAA